MVEEWLRCLTEDLIQHVGRFKRAGSPIWDLTVPEIGIRGHSVIHQHQRRTNVDLIAQSCDISRKIQSLPRRC